MTEMTEKTEKGPRKTTVLLVDDDLDFLEQHKLLLLAKGFEVLTAESQAQAEQLLMTVRPDVAVLDLMLEHVDGGFALCYHIKKLDPKIPVILVTAVTSETSLAFDASTAEERRWVKADVLLPKPIRFEQLLREINRLLEEA
jgi:CheY-like chemotaxis protein